MQQQQQQHQQNTDCNETILKEIHLNITSAPQRTSGDVSEPIDLLDQQLRTLLTENGIDQLLAVQEQVLPLLIGCFKSVDICVSSPTGSGKTLAYVLPIVQNIRKRLLSRVRVLVVVPTKDLVLQVRNVFRKFTLHENLKIIGLTGSVSIKQEQKHFLTGDHSPPDILICTPERLQEHFRSGTPIDLGMLEYFVIDEADRMFESEDNQWYSDILARCHTNPKCRTNPIDLMTRSEGCFVPFVRLLFSATLTQNQAKFSALGLNSPVLVAIGEEKYNLPEGLEQFYFVGNEEHKIAFLLHLLTNTSASSSGYNSILCFANSVKTTTRLCMILNQMTQCGIGYFTGEKSIQERAALLDAFKQKKIQMLICTDSVSRGVDFDRVDCVINFDLPSSLKTYVHRAGRTARAGNSGRCISLLTANENGRFKFMLKSFTHSTELFVLPNYGEFQQTAIQVSQFIGENTVSQEEFEAKSFLLSQFHRHK